jgi:hypothetical protein
MTTTAARLARLGLITKGVLYALLALLALRVAAGAGADADSQGALRSIAGEPMGSVVLGLLAVGFAAYAGWQGYAAWNGDEWPARLSAIVRAIVWSGLAISAARFVFQAGSPPKQEESFTARVLETGPGAWLVAAAGVATIVVGVAFLRHIKDHRYLDDLRAMPQRTCAVVKGVTVTGISAKALVYTLVGAFLIRAALRDNANTGVGLDGALSQVAKTPYGTYLLVAVATGFAAYAVWCWVRARYEDVRSSDG